MAKPNLHIVAAHDPAPSGPVGGDGPDQPEDALALLFAQEAELARQLGEIGRAIPAERERYRAKHNLLMLPSVETLRRLFG